MEEPQRKNSAYEKAMLAYYDNMSEEEREEARPWGEFAMTQVRGGNDRLLRLDGA
jgi:hypothetical protein